MSDESDPADFGRHMRAVVGMPDDERRVRLDTLERVRVLEEIERQCGLNVFERKMLRLAKQLLQGVDNPALAMIILTHLHDAVQGLTQERLSWPTPVFPTRLVWSRVGRSSSPA
jgi:hypothetical protein